MANNTLRSQVDLFNRFVDIAKNDLKHLQTNLIFIEDNVCHAFGRYRIKNTAPIEVWDNDEFIGCFNSVRSALGWCTAEKYRYFELAALIRQFDERLQVAEQAVETRRIGKHTTDPVKIAKMQHRIMHKFRAQAELEKYVSKAKYLQIRGFNNDTQRNSRIKTQTTSF